MSAVAGLEGAAAEPGLAAAAEPAVAEAFEVLAVADSAGCRVGAGLAVEVEMRRVVAGRMLDLDLVGLVAVDRLDLHDQLAPEVLVLLKDPVHLAALMTREVNGSVAPDGLGSLLLEKRPAVKQPGARLYSAEIAVAAEGFAAAADLMAAERLVGHFAAVPAAAAAAVAAVVPAVAAAVAAPREYVLPPAAGAAAAALSASVGASESVAVVVGDVVEGTLLVACQDHPVETFEVP